MSPHLNAAVRLIGAWRLIQRLISPTGWPAGNAADDERGCSCSTADFGARGRDGNLGHDETVPLLSSATIEAIRAVVAYNWADEVRDYATCDDDARAAHILHDLQLLDRLVAPLTAGGSSRRKRRR